MSERHIDSTTAGSTNADPQRASHSSDEAVLRELASVFLNSASPSPAGIPGDGHEPAASDDGLPKREDMYRVLVEQIPAVVFIAYLDRRVSEAYVSPQIESAIGFSQEECLGDPIRWCGQIHTDEQAALGR